jgi:hypothetical protein
VYSSWVLIFRPESRRFLYRNLQPSKNTLAIAVARSKPLRPYTNDKPRSQP